MCLISHSNGRLGNSLSTYLIMCLLHSIKHLVMAPSPKCKQNCKFIIKLNYCIKKVQQVVARQVCIPRYAVVTVYDVLFFRK